MKASRLALLASSPLCCALLASATAHALDARTAWSDVWRTPDQQGQALLEAGQPAQAAERFHDPRRRAYADLEAGRYQDAAKLLSPFTDTRSEYNRGNALAKAGQLQAALASYDAALKQAPEDKDIRHNRDLVAQALQRQQRSSRNGKQGSHGTGSSGQQQQAGAGQRGGSGSQQSGSPGAQSGGGGQTAANGSRNGGNQAGHSGQPGGGGIQSGAGGPQAAGASGSGTSKEAPGQAQRDAAVAAAFAREQQQRGAAGNMSQSQGSQRNGASALSPNGAKGPDTGLLAGGTQTPKQQPESERQLALDQWLRQIPDSPAGLLQRKFLIEHMMKQQEGEEPQGGGQ